MAYFPMFVDIKGRDCLIIGGGKVALRKVKVLLDFDARVHVVAPYIDENILHISKENENLETYQRNMCEDDFTDKVLVIAATDDSEVNHMIADMAKERKIPVNAVDQVEDCTFIFPSYQREKDVVAAYSSGGNSPVITQYLRDMGKKYLTDFVGDLAEYLGSIRGYVKENTQNETVRKHIYKEIFEQALINERLPEKHMVEEIIEKWKE